MARKKKDVALTPFGLPADHAEFLESLKSRVQQAQTKAMLSVNRELIQLYWDIGRLIFERQEEAGWGQSVLERLADDLQRAPPGFGGFSRSNVFRMNLNFAGECGREYNDSEEPTGSRGNTIGSP